MKESRNLIGLLAVAVALSFAGTASAQESPFQFPGTSCASGAFDSRWVVTDAEQAKTTYDEATRRARGELGYPEPRARVVGNLIGAPIRDKMIHYAPVEEAARVKDCAVLFIVAEKEELFDNKDHAKLAYDRMPGAKKKYVSVPNITHYGIYREQRQQAIKLAIEWFDQYLKK